MIQPHSSAEAAVLLHPPLDAAIGSRCPYCNERMDAKTRRPTRDHIHPRSKGGSFAKPGNAVIACDPCNQDKGSLTLRQFLAWLVKQGDKRAPFVAAFIAQHSKTHRIPGRKARCCGT